MWYDVITKWMLQSPLHGLLSNNVMLVTYEGWKSHRLFTVAVNYVRDDYILSVISFRHRNWWRSLRGGAPVTVRLKRQTLDGRGIVIDDCHEVAAALMAYLQRKPRYAPYLGVTLDTLGCPDAADVVRAAQDHVVVRIVLAESVPHESPRQRAIAPNGVPQRRKRWLKKATSGNDEFGEEVA